MRKGEGSGRAEGMTTGRRLGMPQGLPANCALRLGSPRSRRFRTPKSPDPPCRAQSRVARGDRGLAPQGGTPPREEHGVSAPMFRSSNCAPLPEVEKTRRKRWRWSRSAGLASLAATFAAAGSSLTTGTEGPGLAVPNPETSGSGRACARCCGAAEWPGRKTSGP